ncbi:unnamed protein product [Sphagnum jensenii]|uniref:Uncharacterized protein n=1 Tax=Sphagnum jensenii TaxID=128206 RepID=A0ABP0WBQ1_9BRYO
MDMAKAMLRKAMLLENQAALALFTISVGSLEGDKAVEYVQLRRVEEMQDFGEDFHNTSVGREAIQGPSLETDIPIEYELM